MAVRIELVFAGEDELGRTMRIGCASRVTQDPIVRGVETDPDGTPVLVTYMGRRLRLEAVHAKLEA